MPTLRNFAQAQAALREFYGPSAPYTLDRMRALMAALGDPQNELRVIHVAGTSGKTSTCYYIASLLKTAGLKTGLTVSPHVDTVNERVQIDLVPLPEAEFCAELGEFLDVVAATNLEPSYFEVMVAFAYWEFVRHGVEYAVVEVGLGGLLDGTNVGTRADKICVITDIGLDHTEVLGDTLGKIAAQKAGIILPGNEVFMFRQGPEVMKAVEAACQQAAGAQLHLVPPPQEKWQLPLFQEHNFGLAQAVAAVVLERASRPALNREQLQRASEVYIPARMEVVRHGGKTIIIDGAHNAQKLQTLFESIQERFPRQSRVGLIGFVEGDTFRLQQALDVLERQLSHIIVTSFYTEKDYPKHSVSPETVRDYVAANHQQDVEIVPQPAAALTAVLARPEKLVVVTGSFYLLNHIRPLLKEPA